MGWRSALLEIPSNTFYYAALRNYVGEPLYDGSPWLDILPEQL